MTYQKGQVVKLGDLAQEFIRFPVPEMFTGRIATHYNGLGLIQCVHSDEDIEVMPCYGRTEQASHQYYGHPVHVTKRQLDAAQLSSRVADYQKGI